MAATFQTRTEPDGTKTFWDAKLVHPWDPLPPGGIAKWEAARGRQAWLTIERGEEGRKTQYHGRRSYQVKRDALCVAVEGTMMDGDFRLCWTGERSIKELAAAIHREESERLKDIDAIIRGEQPDGTGSETLDYTLHRDEGVLLLALLTAIRENKLPALMLRIQSRAIRSARKLGQKDARILSRLKALMKVTGELPLRKDIRDAYNNKYPDLLTAPELTSRLKALGLAWIPSGVRGANK